MHGRKVWGLVALGAIGGAVTLSLSWGQDRSPAGVDSSSAPMTLELTPARSTQEAFASRSGPDPSKYNALEKQMYLSASRGADWLARANRSDGRFIYGSLPALKANLEGDHYLRQVGAAVALAREARFTGNERHAAIARQAVLTLLLETTVEDTRYRHTTLPSTMVNRLAAAGLLVLAINELPSPGEDLLQQSEQLCAFIGQQQRPHGALRYSESQSAPAEGGPAIGADPAASDYVPAPPTHRLL